MKKIIASALGLALVGGVAVTTASAVESQFGGYWRTRFTYDENLEKATGSNYTTDTRTRLYYTAKFSDDFKFVNKFEFNTTWGDNNGGDLGADGTGNWRIKNSYVDFNLGMVNTKVGIHSATIARGFVFADDFSGATITADFGMVKVPFVYMAALSSDAQGAPNTGVAADDANIFSLMPTFKVNDMVSLTPHGTYEKITSANTDIYWVGFDADLKMDSVNAWFTGIYNGGQVNDNDISAYLVAAGADAGLVHGQGFYASGDKYNNIGDTDTYQTIQKPGTAAVNTGTSYYWSEIMGLGIFDNTASAGSPGDHLSNIWAANLGVTVKPMDKVKIDVDAWYAQRAEDINKGTVAAPRLEKDLGLELDGKLTYALMDDLNAEFVFAYLFAGDATGPDDVIETGVQLSLKF